MKIISTALVAAIALSLTTTNPDSDAYLEYVVWKFRQTDCKAKLLSSQAQFFCRTIQILPQSATRSFLEEYTYRQDYILFSIYRTDLGEFHNRSIGVGGQFF